MRIEKICWGNYTAQINVTRGGNCISLRNTKYQCKILREPDYGKGLDNPYLYGMPILFPVNRISGGSFEFEGRTYQFPVNEEATNCFLHGTLHGTPFEVVEQEAHRIVLSYRATEEALYHTFPHAFEIRQEYSLSENGMRHEVEIINLSEHNMPVFVGYHTTFNVPFRQGAEKEDLLVKVDCKDEFERDMSVYLPTGRMLDPDEISESLAKGNFVPDRYLSRHYRSDGSGIMSITDTQTGMKVVYENCSELRYRLIYGEGKDFICLEPQTCMANCVNAPFPREETGFLYLKPGEKKEFRSRISLQIS